MYVYSLVVNHKSYTLPNKNIFVVEEMERVSQIDSVRGMTTRDKFAQILGFVKALVGEESANEIFGTSSLEEMDLSQLTIVFRMIVDAYNKPITDYNNKKSSEALSSIPSDKIEKIGKLMDIAKDIPNDRLN